MSSPGLQRQAGGARSSECMNMGKTIKSVAMVDLIVILISLVLLVVSILYYYLKKVTGANQTEIDENQKKKNKLLSILIIVAAVFVLIGAGLSFMQFSAAGKVAKTCLQ
jgi:heme/copper-type cytochrome/quinol oxidase subunit 2